MNLSLATSILDTWDNYSHRLVDDDRTTTRLASLLRPDTGAAWYPSPTTGYFFIEQAGLFGNITLLGDKDPRSWRKSVRDAMLENALARVTAWVPSPVNEYKSFLRAIGFRPEGKMKLAAIYNNQFVDLDVYGFMIDYKSPRRRRRGRRKAETT